MARIGILGGTFNPPHTGHILAAKEAIKALELDKLLLIPAATPPHKTVPEGSPDAELRLTMTRAAVAEYPEIEVSDIELRRTGLSYTSDTLRELRRQYPEPENTLFLIMGTDMFLTLRAWHEPEAIMSMAVIVAMSREEKSRYEAMEQEKQLLEKAFGANIILLRNSPIEISSSTVRRMMILGGAQHYVVPAVMKLVAENHLYGYGLDYKGLSDEELRRIGLGLLKSKRVNHVIGCAETAVKLAHAHGADETVALRAGLLHDVTKALDGNDQLLLVEEYGIILDDFERRYPKLLHAKTGAAVAEHVFGESPEVVSAINWHTTGRADMTLMEKIIYIADYMEPNRSFPGVDTLRERVWEDLDQGLLLGFEMCIEELIRENKPVCSTSQGALDFLRAELAAKEI